MFVSGFFGWSNNVGEAMSLTIVKAPVLPHTLDKPKKLASDKHQFSDKKSLIRLTPGRKKHPRNAWRTPSACPERQGTRQPVQKKFQICKNYYWLQSYQQFCDFSINRSCKTYLGPVRATSKRIWHLVYPYYHIIHNQRA